jgi:hypothetical protein
MFQFKYIETSVVSKEMSLVFCVQFAFTLSFICCNKLQSAFLSPVNAGYMKATSVYRGCERVLVAMHVSSLVHCRR